MDTIYLTKIFNFETMISYFLTMESKRMTKLSSPQDRLTSSVKIKSGSWVQTERKAHEAWAKLIARKPRSAMLLHLLVAQMGHQNAVVISQKTLAKMMGLHERTVRRAVSDLINERWIQVVQLHGTGTVSAYVVNDRVAWGQSRDQLNLSVFSATVIANMEDQSSLTIEDSKLRQIPTLYPGERQLPDESHDDPPSQELIPGFEPDLPSVLKSEDTI
jgi:hypothetical protein